MAGKKEEKLRAMPCLWEGEGSQGQAAPSLWILLCLAQFSRNYLGDKAICTHAAEMCLLKMQTQEEK